MANIKSAKKRILVERRNAERNKDVKSAIKTAVKKVYAAIDAKDKAAAEASLKEAEAMIASAAQKGILHDKTASRKISRLTIAVNKVA
ncbi:MAG: 30S ribosomal protein S20 [Lachnospiraceae bacterium]|nr:30S ribosomal protein S20 [Lachnospiraceae bacterium]